MIQKFNRIKSLFQLFYETFIKPPKIWRRPKQCEIILYDASGLDILEPYLAAYSLEIISLRGESVNIPCLIRALLKLNFWRFKPIQAYSDVFIEIASPKIILTFIDNNVAFYSISDRFPKIKTIFIQNGIRGGAVSVFDELVQGTKYHVDYMLVFASSYGKEYQKYITGKAITIGSLINNNVKKCIDISEGHVFFISQYIDKPKDNMPLVTGFNGIAISWEEFFKMDILVLKFLQRWCINNKKKLRIAGRVSGSHNPEHEFYDEYLAGGDWEYIPKSDKCSSYKLVDESNITVFIDSALGYESIGRGNKTASFSCRDTKLNGKTRRFGWPAMLPSNGPFWTNDADETEFQRILDYLNTVSDKEWDQTLQHYSKDLMGFDPDNSRFVTLLDQLLRPQKNIGHM